MKKAYFTKNITIKLTKHEMDLIISALEADAYRSLEAVTELVNKDMYSAKINADMYFQCKELARKVGVAKEEAE